MEMLMTNRARSEAEATDVYGYLKPTFHQFSTAFSTSPATAADTYSEPIPIESYCNSTPSDSAMTTSTTTSSMTKDSSSSSSEFYDAPRSFTTALSDSLKTESTALECLEVPRYGKTTAVRSPSPTTSSSTASSSTAPEFYDTPRSLTASNSNLNSIKSDNPPIFLALQSVQV